MSQMSCNSGSCALTGRNLFFHMLAFVSVCIWGVTFVSTKILISAGLAPTEIFIYRFSLAYVCVAVASHSRLWCDSFRDEMLMCLAGLTGGSLYFITENTALEITFASNVSLLICTAPLFTMLLGKVFFHLPLRWSMVAGSFIALCGVGLVVFNGAFNLGVNPLGDILTLIAAFLWAVYCLLLKVLGNRYPVLFVTRKVFFYGLITAGLFALVEHTHFSVELLREPQVYSNLLFLGILASML